MGGKKPPTSESIGVLGDEKTHKYTLYRAFFGGISHRGPTLGPGYIPGTWIVSRNRSGGMKSYIAI